MEYNFNLKLNNLRELIKINHLDGFLIPSNDEFQSEYVSEYFNRLKFLTGFTGSNGIALITMKDAILFTDGRYIYQAEQELQKIFTVQDITNIYNNKFLNGKVGYDPKLHLNSNLKKYKNCTLVECDNLVDQIWHNKPSKKDSNFFQYPLKYSGESSESKLYKLKEHLQSKDIYALIITDPSNICWLLNIRGHDIEYNPILLSYAIFYKDGKLDIFSNCKEHIPLKDFSIYLKKLMDNKIQIDPNSASSWIINQLNHKIIDDDPCTLAKAYKNNIEINMSKKIHIDDGIALCKLLYWIEKNYKKEQISEINIANKILELRSNSSNFLYPSFATIAGFGEHGAIIHYKATEETNKLILNDGLLLIDSGGQYFGGTTDITRTILIGKAKNQQKLDFTLVLKGHIALAMAEFPINTRGVDLDILARQFLYKYGKDYAHGTGHGVGNCLNVHEGPQRISKMGMQILKEGMIISNEPGYYKNGEYGIRIENLILVKKLKNNYLGLETISLAPIDQKLIIKELLTAPEKKWINHYHKTVYSKISPHLNKQEQIWLKKQTEIIV